MLRKVVNRIRVHFRNTRSDRVAQLSYRNYHKQIRKIFYNNVLKVKNRVPFLKSKQNKNI